MQPIAVQNVENCQPSSPARSGEMTDSPGDAEITTVNGKVALTICDNDAYGHWPLYFTPEDAETVAAEIVRAARSIRGE